MRTDDVPVREDVRANRRWLIGITITLVFGMFGAIMALLAYNNTVQPAARMSRPAASRPATTAPVATPPAASPVEPAKEERKEGRREERRDKKHDRD